MLLQIDDMDERNRPTICICIRFLTLTKKGEKYMPNKAKQNRPKMHDMKYFRCYINLLIRTTGRLLRVADQFE